MKGFGGKFGVQKDRQDRSAVGWDHVEKLEKHASQKGTPWGENHEVFVSNIPVEIFFLLFTYILHFLGIDLIIDIINLIYIEINPNQLLRLNAKQYSKHLKRFSTNSDPVLHGLLHYIEKRFVF